MTTKDKTISAEVKSQARLVAEKKPAPPMVPVTSGDSVTFSERGVVDANDAAGRPTTAYRISDSGVPHASAADIDDAGKISFRIEGAPEQHGQGVVLAASHLIQRIATISATRV